MCELSLKNFKISGEISSTSPGHEIGFKTSKTSSLSRARAETPCRIALYMNKTRFSARAVLEFGITPQTKIEKDVQVHGKGVGKVFKGVARCCDPGEHILGLFGCMRVEFWGILDI